MNGNFYISSQTIYLSAVTSFKALKYILPTMFYSENNNSTFHILYCSEFLFERSKKDIILLLFLVPLTLIRRLKCWRVKRWASRMFENINLCKAINSYGWYVDPPYVRSRCLLIVDGNCV